MGGPGPQGPLPGLGGLLGGPQGTRGVGGPGMDMGGQFGLPGSMGQSPGQDVGREPPRDPRMMGDGRGMQFGQRTGMPSASMAGPANIPTGSVAGGMPSNSRGGVQAPPASVSTVVSEPNYLRLPIRSH